MLQESQYQCSPVASRSTCFEAQFQGIFNTIKFDVPAQADEADAVVDPLSAIAVANIQCNTALAAVHQQSDKRSTSIIRQI